jgi:hypothetical protein
MTTPTLAEYCAAAPGPGQPALDIPPLREAAGMCSAT